MPRQQYTVTFPDGHEQSFNGPPGMTDADLIQRAQQERKFTGGEIATSFSGGAARHLLENEPATVSTLLNTAALATGAGAPVMAAVPAATSGLKRLSQFLATGHADPIGLGEVAGDVAEGATMGYGGQGLAAGARMLGRAKPALTAAGGRAAATVASKLGLPAVASDVAVPAAKWALRLTNPKLAALDIATSKPVLGAVEGLGEALTPDAVSGAFGNVARGLKPGIEPAAAAVPRLSPAAAARQAVREANPAWEATGWPGTPPPASAPEYPAWLRSLGDQATEAQPVARRVAGLEATGTSPPAAPAAAGGADFPEWLRQMRARVATEAEPIATGLEATGTSAPAAAPTSGPTWDSFTSLKRAAGVPESPAAGLAATGTSAPGAAPAAGPTWDAFTRMGTRQAPAAAPAATAAGDEAASLAALRRAATAPESEIPAVAPRGAKPRTRTQFAEFSPEARAARAAARTPAAAAAESAPAAIPEFDTAGGSALDALSEGGPMPDEATLEALLNSPAFRALSRTIK